MPFPFFGRGTLYSQGLSNVSMVIKFLTHICERFIVDFSQPLDSLYASGGFVWIKRRHEAYLRVCRRFHIRRLGSDTDCPGGHQKPGLFHRGVPPFSPDGGELAATSAL